MNIRRNFRKAQSIQKDTGYFERRIADRNFKGRVGWGRGCMYRDSSMHIKSVNALTYYFEPNYLTSHFFGMNISIQKVGSGGGMV